MPTMPSATSAPANLKIPDDRREVPLPHRATTTQPLRDYRKEIPSMPRAHTMPSTNASVRRNDNVPARGSNLKHAETQDSGYSSSSPATPDMNGTSPLKYSAATRYQIQIVDEAEEFRGHRTILVEPEDSHRRTRSPVREQPRPALSTSGKRPSRAATAYTPRSSVDKPATRPSLARHESSRPTAQAREPPHLSRGGSGHRERKVLYREVSSDEQDSNYKRRVSSEKVASPRSRVQDGSQSALPYRDVRKADRDGDYYPGSLHRSELRHPGLSTRRPSVC